MTCLGVVLAGGNSFRMGEDKATLLRDNRTMLDYSRELLTLAGCNKVVVSGGCHNGIADLVENAGPLGGIYSVLKTISAPELLIMPVDMPLMTKDGLTRLLKTGRAVAKPVHYKNNPLPLYLPINGYVENFMANSIQSANDRGPSFKQLFACTGATALPPLNISSLTNTNTPAEWQAAKREVEQHRRENVSSIVN